MKTTDATALQTTEFPAPAATEAKTDTKPGKPAPEAKTGAAPARRPWEEWARQKGTGAAVLRSAAILRHWAIGKAVTEAEFDAAVEAARNLTFR